MPKPCLDTTNFSYSVYGRVLYLEVKQSEREADHSPPATTEVKNGRSCASTHPACIHSVVRDNSNFCLLALITYTLKMEVEFSFETSAT